MRRSLGQISDQGSSATIGTNPDSQHMDQDTVLALTQDVKTFSEYLAKLHNTVHNRNGGFPHQFSELLAILQFEKAQLHFRILYPIN